jgi:hypothetical protein
MAGVPGWQASVVSSQTDILTAAQMLGHVHAVVTARHYARAGENAAERAAEALEREVLQPDNPVQLTKKWELRGKKREPQLFVIPRRYRENEGRTQRDSNPRHLVPKKKGPPN